MEFLGRTDIRIDFPRIHEKMHNFDVGIKDRTKSLIDKSEDLGITFLAVYIATSCFFGKVVAAESTPPRRRSRL
jgi:hypothetical protein